MIAISQAIRQAQHRLAAAGADAPATDARVLVAHVLCLSREALITEGNRPLDAAELERIGAMVARREAGEPLAYITGTKEFWSLPFGVRPGVLIPRPDTETLIEAALAAFKDRAAPLRILDLGTGSGCLLLTLLRLFPLAWGVGVDVSAPAIAVARENAAALDVSNRAAFMRGSWCAALRGPFDLIVSNPPYIAPTEIAGLAREVREFEPLLALDGGRLGLSAYGILAEQTPSLLRPSGRLILEVGIGQSEAVQSLLLQAGLKSVTAVNDLTGRARAVVGQTD
ncbi:MAG: peptide chain release factor N(5)-glutamine methyltransferase [Alphaproteobacteria bacterium]|nr:peptide chain release factor N(5)-glutamine methyltransferase [Alphaproteobacteria bacterium]